MFDLVEVLRRVVLQEEIPPGEGFRLPAADADRMQAALCEAEPKYFEEGVRRSLGEDAAICNKPGWWKGQCIDQAYISDPGTGRRFLLAATGSCGRIRSIAGPVLEAAGGLTGTPLQPDAGEPIEVSLEVDEGGLIARLETEADWALVWVDDRLPVVAVGRDGRLVADLGELRAGVHHLAVMGMSYGVRVGYRSVGFEVGGG